MKLRITEAVLAEAYRAKVCRERMEELAESIRKSVKERHSLPKMRIRLAEYGNDTELMLAAVSALRKDKEAPSARDRDFRAWMHIPADTRSAFPVISVQSPVSIQCCWQS